MKKSVLLGVSISAILGATGANAAGYTCEELIEYTSCNTGYALMDGNCVCDGGYYTNGDKCTICPIGTYSSVNASECTTCPTTGLVDPDNNAIVATTASAGSKNISACMIPTNVTIKGETGLYHFKSSCAYSGLTPGTSSGGGNVMTKEQVVCEGESVGGQWVDGSCDCGVGSWFYSQSSEDGMCVGSDADVEMLKICDASDVASVDWGDASCRCDGHEEDGTIFCDAENGCPCDY